MGILTANSSAKTNQREAEEFVCSLFSADQFAQQIKKYSYQHVKACPKAEVLWFQVIVVNMVRLVSQ